MENEIETDITSEGNTHADRAIVALREPLNTTESESELTLSNCKDRSGTEYCESKGTEIKLQLDNLSKIVSSSGQVTRQEAIEADAYNLIIQAWKWPFKGKHKEFESHILKHNVVRMIVREAALRALAILTAGCPDIIDGQTYAILAQVLNFSVTLKSNEEIELAKTMKIQALKIIKNICIRNETNRAALTDVSNILHPNFKLIESFCDVVGFEPATDLIRAWCEALSAFILNDDKRIIPNRAEERKRMIAHHGGITILVQLLTIKLMDASVLNSIVIAIAMMASSKEHSNRILAAGALPGIDRILQNYTTQDNDRLIVNTISCIQHLCLSPDLPKLLEKGYIIRNMISAAERMKGRYSHLEVVMTAIGHVTIGSASTVSTFLQEGGVTSTFGIIEQYKDNVYVLKGCCLVLGNVVTLGNELGKTSIIQLNGELILKEIMKNHPELAQSYVKPVLKYLDI